MTWVPYSVAETWSRIQRGEAPWVALGDFLDDWRRIGCPEHVQLIDGAPRIADQPDMRWPAFLAAAVQFLAAADDHPFPPWTNDPRLFLDRPWFLYPGPNLRAWQLADTPAAFKVRNIFGGDRILDRV